MTRSEIYKALSELTDPKKIADGIAELYEGLGMTIEDVHVLVPFVDHEDQSVRYEAICGLVDWIGPQRAIEFAKVNLFPSIAATLTIAAAIDDEIVVFMCERALRILNELGNFPAGCFLESLKKNATWNEKFA